MVIDVEKNKNTPKIRFKGFTDAWEQRKLGDIGSTFTGLSGKTKEDFGHGDAKFVTYMNVFSNPIGNLEKTESIEIDNKQNEVKYGDIFFTTSSETPEEVGMSSVWLENKANVYLNSFCFGYRPLEKNNPYYMAYMLRANNFRSKMIFLAQGISRYNISKNAAMNIEIQMPKNKEQELIGKLFYEIDNLITLHQGKYDNLLKIKKSLLEKMFPQSCEKIPKWRFKGFTDTWEQCKLEDFGKATGGTSIESEFSENGIYKVISIGSYSENSKYNDQGIRAILSDKTKGKILNKSDLTMILNDKTANGRIIGRVLYIDKSGTYVYNQRTERIEIYKEYFEPIFIYQLLNAPQIRNKIIKQSQGNTQIFVNWNGIKNTDYLVPNKTEQIKIGELFTNLDNLITLHHSKCDKLIKIKKSLLEKMFI